MSPSFKPQGRCPQPAKSQEEIDAAVRLAARDPLFLEDLREVWHDFATADFAGEGQ